MDQPFETEEGGHYDPLSFHDSTDAVTGTSAHAKQAPPKKKAPPLDEQQTAILLKRFAETFTAEQASVTIGDQVFSFSPLTLGSMVRLQALCYPVRKEIEKAGSAKSIISQIEAAGALGDVLSQMTAVILTNEKQGPQKALEDYLTENITGLDACETTLVMLSHMSLADHFDYYGIEQEPDELPLKKRSQWHLAGSIVKYFRFSFDYVLWQISYANLTMLSACIPSFELSGSEAPFEKAEQQHDEGFDGFAGMSSLFGNLE